MTSSSVLPGYIIGTAFVGVGMLGLVSPVRAYKIFGLPLGLTASPQAAAGDTAKVAEIASDKVHPAAASLSRLAPSPSPFLFPKAARDITIGLAFVAFEATGNPGGVSVLAGAIAVAGVVDGWVVWQYGGDEFRRKAWAHWYGTILTSVWFAMRYWKFS